MVNAIIVGNGLAGVHYALQLQAQHKDFVMFYDTALQNASLNAAGICNPTVLKRYSLVWKGTEFLEDARCHYEAIENKWQTNFFENFPIHRYFSHFAEQNQWVEASQKEGLNRYLDSEIYTNSSFGIERKLGFGIIQGAHKLNIPNFFKAFEATLSSTMIRDEFFSYAELKMTRSGVEYKDVKAEHIVFCEGYGIKQNPWFQDLPLTGSKGEFLVVKIPKLNPKIIFKGTLFIAPLIEDLFWVGATFSPHDKTTKPSIQGKNELISKLDEMVNLPYEILEHHAAVRPTVIDRRPLLGTHTQYKRLHLFNGLGTRGAMMAPLLAKQLYQWIYFGKELPLEVDIQRFEPYFCNPKEKGNA